jgi:4-hydroxy-tetrahydrodipicolinate synthase
MRLPEGMPGENNSMTTNLRGILAPALTAVTDDFQIHEERTLAHFRWLLENGCDGLVVFGTTSEANSFSVIERRQLLERAVSVGINAKKLITGTGCCSLADSIELTKHAVQVGCAGALTLPPFYYKGVSDDGLFQYFVSLIEGVADERLRLYLYHIPPIAIVSFSLALVEKLIAKYPGIVVGIKDSSGDWAHTKDLIERFGRFAFDVFPGNESYLLDALELGAAGCISGMTNVIADSLQMMFKNWRHPEAKVRQELVKRIRLALLKYPPIPAFKAIISKTRDDAAWKNVRPPLLPLTESEFVGLTTELTAAGFEWPKTIANLPIP